MAPEFLLSAVANRCPLWVTSTHVDITYFGVVCRPRRNRLQSKPAHAGNKNIGQVGRVRKERTAKSFGRQKISGHRQSAAHVRNLSGIARALLRRWHQASHASPAEFWALVRRSKIIAKSVMVAHSVALIKKILAERTKVPHAVEF